jgi:hypothetical protein
MRSRAGTKRVSRNQPVQQLTELVLRLSERAVTNQRPQRDQTISGSKKPAHKVSSTSKSKDQALWSGKRRRYLEHRPVFSSNSCTSLFDCLSVPSPAGFLPERLTGDSTNLSAPRACRSCLVARTGDKMVVTGAGPGAPMRIAVEVSEVAGMF